MKTIESYFLNHGHSHHQIQGWEVFLKSILEEIITESQWINEHDVKFATGSVVITVGKGEKEQTHTITFLDVTVWPPNAKESNGEVRNVTAHECRIRKLTYANPITCNVLHEVQYLSEGVEKKRVRRYQDMAICRLPAMVGVAYNDNHEPEKDECLFDEGGYFIINGLERVLTSQLKLRVNTLFVFAGKSPGKYSYIAEIRSLHSTKYRSTSTLKIAVATPKHADYIAVIVPFLMKTPTTKLILGLQSIFTLMGVSDRQQVLDLVCPAQWPLKCKELVETSLKNDILADMTREEILVWVGKNGTQEPTREKQQRYVFHIFQNETLPHIGMDQQPETMRHKAFYIAHMVRKVVRVHFGLELPSDRDHNMNKKLDGPGPLMAVIFRQIYRRFLRNFKQTLTKALNTKKTEWVRINDYINASRITSNMSYHFATGNWSLQKGINMGVVQNLNRMSRIASYSQLRRINTPMNKDGNKNTTPRQLHRTEWGIFCTIETPEGQGVGMTKNLALCTHVCVGNTVDHALFESMIVEWLDLEPFHPFKHREGIVFLNSKMIGVHQNIEAVYSDAIDMRRHQDGIPFDTSIHVEDGNLYLFSDQGRCVRPVFVMENMSKFDAIYERTTTKELFPELLRQGVIEYLDKREEEHLLVASTMEKARSSFKYTHMEIHPMVILGLIGALEVFPHHNQAPRNAFFASMVKQALGFGSLDYAKRMDLHSFVQETPQRPLVSSYMTNVRHQGALPAGMSCIVAICCYGGFNQEDSILLCRQSVERGLGVKTYYHTIVEDCSTTKGEMEYFEQPDFSKHEYVNKRGNANYETIDEDGTPPVGTILEVGDVVIGKTMEVVEIDATGKQKKVKRDKSRIIRKGEEGVVDKVLRTMTKDGLHMIQVKMRQRRVPEIGDKFSSRHGQKGTVGQLIDQWDMPYTADGTTPDIVLNPQALPSRMTIGHLIEWLLGKTCALEGKYGDGTPFNSISVETIAEALKEHGYSKYGSEQMYSGYTGKPMKGKVFIGPTYYNILKHMVRDKMYSRNLGKNTLRNRQPPEGRKRGGGLRFGEVSLYICCFTNQSKKN